MTFDQWKQLVNLLFIEEFGEDADQFPDWLWSDDFKDGLTPVEAFNDYLDAHGIRVGA